jgi:hypothetical protein
MAKAADKPKRVLIEGIYDSKQSAAPFSAA